MAGEEYQHTQHSKNLVAIQSDLIAGEALEQVAAEWVKETRRIQPRTTVSKCVS